MSKNFRAITSVPLLSSLVNKYVLGTHHGTVPNVEHGILREGGFPVQGGSYLFHEHEWNLV